MAQGTSPSIISWMQSLSDQTRTRLLHVLQRNELTVAEICSVVRLPQSTVSRHLRILADDGWLTCRKEGPANLYKMPSTDLDQSQLRLWNLVRDQAGSESFTEDKVRLREVLAARRSRSQDFFSNAHEHWDRTRNDLFGKHVDANAIAAMIDPDSIIGDLGCGTASTSLLLAPWVKKVIAVDSSDAMIRSARQRLMGCENVELRKGELTELPVDKNELDLALLLLVLPYVEAPSVVFERAFEAVNKTGRLVIVDIVEHERSQYREDLGHTWLGFSEKQLRTWLIDAGWMPRRWQPLKPDPESKGPGLFIMTAKKA